MLINNKLIFFFLMTIKYNYENQNTVIVNKWFHINFVYNKEYSMRLKIFTTLP